MKLSIPVRLMAVTTAVISSLLSLSPAKADSSFTETDLNQVEVIAVARPYGENKFDLFIVQQVPGKKKCWEESGTNPIIVKPLLLEFDFTGHCNRATDSNGYSIRVDGQDYGLDLLLRLVPQNGELVLIGSPRKGAKGDIVIGRTQGLTRDFMKIVLEPGWKFSKRTYGTKVLGHFYFSGTQAPVTTEVNPTPEPETPSPPAIPSTPEGTEIPLEIPIKPQ